jgi:uncharacterized protein (DUF697 family)
MTQLDRTSLAKFRILVAVAKADGVLQGAELAALRTAFGAHVATLEAMLEEDVDVDAEIALLDAVDRRLVYQSAFALAHADGHAQTFEISILRKILPNEGEGSFIAEVWGEALDTFLPSRIVAEADAAKRESEVREDTFKYAVLAAVAAAVPVPGVAVIADLAVVAIQAKLVHDIGLYWGHDLDARSVRAFVGAAAGSVGLRIAINNLARFVPGWGSAFAAGTSFASTYAMGVAADAWFANGRAMPEKDLQSLFQTAQGQGQGEYARRSADIRAAESARASEIASLNQRLADGEIDRATYERLLLGAE